MRFAAGTHHHRTHLKRLDFVLLIVVDGICQTDESEYTCPADCAVATCGDGVCDPAESPRTCPADCIAGCGDGYCDIDYVIEGWPGICSIGFDDCDDGSALAHPGFNDEICGDDLIHLTSRHTIKYRSFTLR